MLILRFVSKATDLFSPERRKGGDMFEVDPYLVTVVHVSDYNAYKMLNVQVRNIENDEVSFTQYFWNFRSALS